MKAIVAGGSPVLRPTTLERLPVPASISDLRHEDVRQARLIQQEISRRFEEYLAQGLAVVGVERLAEGGAYLFGRWE